MKFTYVRTTYFLRFLTELLAKFSLPTREFSKRCALREREEREREREGGEGGREIVSRKFGDDLSPFLLSPQPIESRLASLSTGNCWSGCRDHLAEPEFQRGCEGGEVSPTLAVRRIVGRFRGWLDRLAAKWPTYSG